MAYSIEMIEGIGGVYGERLAAAGIRTTNDLLKRCRDRGGRRRLSESTGVSERQLLRWVNLADLMRITGIGPQYSELLEATGVDTVKELRHRQPRNLAEAMREVNESKRLTRRNPPPVVVARWVRLARMIEPAVSH